MRTRILLLSLAAGILLARLLDLFGLIAPEFHRDGVSVSWMDVVLPLTLVSIWIGCYAWQLGNRAILPVHDPGFDEALGPLIHRHEGTLMRFTGDGLMVFFNDPIPCPDPAARAVRLAVDMREAVMALAERWRRRGHEIGFGVGIAQGYATLGRIGFKDHIDYTAMGTVTNPAARLCDAAQDGQILISQRAAASVETLADMEPLGEIPLKGLTRPGTAHAVLGLR